MNQEAVKKALSLNNINHVSEATRIAPTTLQRIIDGKHMPEPDEIDALAGFFQGEYYLSGVDFNWKRKLKQEEPVGALPMAGETVPGPEYPPVFEPPPNLQPGPAPTGNGAPPNSEGFTGMGQKVRK